MVTGAELAEQAVQAALVPGEGQPSIQHLIGADGRAQLVDGLISDLDPGRLDVCLGGDRHRDQPAVLAMRAGHFDQRLVLGACDQVELAASQALAALRALKTACLPAENIEKVHDRFFYPVAGRLNQQT